MVGYWWKTPLLSCHLLYRSPPDHATRLIPFSPSSSSDICPSPEWCKSVGITHGLTRVTLIRDLHVPEMLNQSETCHYLVVPHVPSWCGMLTWVGSMVQMWSWFNGYDWIVISQFQHSCCIGFFASPCRGLRNSDMELDQQFRSNLGSMAMIESQFCDFIILVAFGSLPLHVMIYETLIWS